MQICLRSMCGTDFSVVVQNGCELKIHIFNWTTRIKIIPMHIENVLVNNCHVMLTYQQNIKIQILINSGYITENKTIE